MSHPFDLSGRHFLVTGASSGLGRATSILASGMGARLTLTGRDEQRLEETRAMLEGSGHQVMPRDLSNSGGIPAWLKEVAAAGGPLEGVAHASGVQTVRPLRILDDAYLRGVMDTNFLSAMALVRGFRQRGVCAEGGSIVLFSSVMALKGQAGQTAYCASKGALVSACRALALELAGERIRINCVAPGLVRTPMADRLQAALPADQYQAVEAAHPLGLGDPADVAAAVVYLLSKAARWVTGTTLVVDGGYTAH